MRLYPTKFLPAVFCVMFSLQGISQTVEKTALQNRITKLIAASKAKVGVGVKALDETDSLIINNEHHYPMQSVFKFPLAMAVLDLVDRGKLSLQKKVHIPKGALDSITWGPLFRDFPNRDFDITVSDLLMYSVSKSDNNACDLLFTLIGGPKRVNDYVHRIGVKNISIVATEAQMKADWAVQYTNWCQPDAMLQLLVMLDKGTALSKNSTAFLVKLMTESSNPPERIKGQLPAETVVAHKTGTSGPNENGLRAATNDVGILTLPNGRRIAMVVYVSDYKGDSKSADHLVAAISKAVWDYFISK